MRKFSFSMNSILNTRQAQKQGREHELAAAQYSLREEEKKLRFIGEKIDGVLNQQISGTPTASYFIQRQKYLTMLKHLRRQQQIKVNKARTVVQNCMKRLRDADIELKKMEKLQERELKDWKLEFQRDEQKQSDEIGTTLSVFKPRTI